MAKKAANTSNKDSAQLSLFDDLLAQLNNAGGKISSDQITAVIGKLTSARDRAKKREAQEKKQKAEEEAARKRLEEQARKTQHIQEVTSMDLPLDWFCPGSGQNALCRFRCCSVFPCFRRTESTRADRRIPILHRCKGRV